MPTIFKTPLKVVGKNSFPYAIFTDVNLLVVKRRSHRARLTRVVKDAVLLGSMAVLESVAGVSSSLLSKLPIIGGPSARSGLRQVLRGSPLSRGIAGAPFEVLRRFARKRRRRAFRRLMKEVRGNPTRARLRMHGGVEDFDYLADSFERYKAATARVLSSAGLCSLRGISLEAIKDPKGSIFNRSTAVTITVETKAICRKTQRRLGKLLGGSSIGECSGSQVLTALRRARRRYFLLRRILRGLLLVEGEILLKVSDKTWFWCLRS